MQNRYVGDIGDYVKYAMLRALPRDLSLGVAWYLYPDEEHNDDGKHVAYLGQADKWATLDPELFACLGGIIQNGERSVESVAASGILPGASFSGEVLAHDAGSSNARAEWRQGWFSRVREELSGCDVVFADPDNGLCDDELYKPSRRSMWKRMPLGEALALADGRTGVFYHHNTRFPGGHAKEIRHWLDKLPDGSFGLYCKAFSCRTFFVVHPTDAIHDALRGFAERWSGHATLYA